MKHSRPKMMNMRSFQPFALMAVAISILGFSPAVAAGQNRNPSYSRVVLPSGTVLPVVLDMPLSSNSSQSGDKFTATVKYGSDDAGLPRGTRLEGIVREAFQSGDGKPGVLDFDFRRLILPNGESRSISASLYSLDGKAVRRSDGRLVATSDKNKDKLKWVGIGAGGGLLLGTLTKQNALLSTILGAGAGFLFNELGNKKPGDVNLKQGSTFGVRLDSQFAYNSDERSDSQSNADRRGDGEQGFDPRPRRTDTNDWQNIDRRADALTDEQRELDRSRNGYRTYLAGDEYQSGSQAYDREVQFTRTLMPYMREEQVMVPLGLAAKGAEFQYRYVQSTRTIYARNDKVKLVVGSLVATVDGEQREMHTGAEIRNGAIYVPLEFISWAADGTATWGDSGRMIVQSTRHQR